MPVKSRPQTKSLPSLPVLPFPHPFALRRPVFRFLLASILVASGLTLAPPVLAGHLLVLNSEGDTLSVVDVNEKKELRRIRVGSGPHHLMALPDDSALVVGLTSVNKLAFLDRKTGEVTKTVSMLDPYQMAFSPDRKTFVTTALRMNYVDIYAGDLSNTTKPLARVKTGDMPSHLVFSPDSKFVYVTEQGGNAIVQIDVAAGKVVRRVPVGLAPAGIWLTPDGKHLLVGIMGENFVAVVDRESFKVTGKIITGKGAHNFLPMGDKRRLLVTNRAEDTISIIDMTTLKVLETFKAPGNPDCMELTRDGKTLWYTARIAKKVVAIDMATKAVVASVPVGRSPHGLYFFDHAPRE